MEASCRFLALEVPPLSLKKLSARQPPHFVCADTSSAHVPVHPRHPSRDAIKRHICQRSGCRGSSRSVSFLTTA